MTLQTTNKQILDTKRQAFRSWFFPLTLVAVLFLVFAYIEFRKPYFFLQDDNRFYYLPNFSHVFKSLLNGELALFNFHQFLGTPSLASGQTGALYPLVYVAVGLSELLWGHVFASIDILVILHLTIGGVGTYFLIRFFDVDRKVAWFAGVTWPLSSFVVYVSDSWVIIASAAAYFPWLLLCSLRLYKKPSLQTMICAVMTRLLLFYSGHIQYFVYSVIFEFITVFLYVLFGSDNGARKARSIKFLIKYAESYLYVLLLSLPLLLPMWNQMAISTERSGRVPLRDFFTLLFPVDQLFLGLFFPFLQANDNHYAPFMHLLNLSHIGYLTVILLVTGIVLLLVPGKSKSSLFPVKMRVFILPAIIASLWTSSWIFNCVVYLIPMLNRFRWSFKLAFFLDFYLIIIATFTLAVLFKHIRAKEFTRNIILSLFVFVQIFNFVYLYTANPIESFTVNYADQLPLEEPLHDKLTVGRILTVGFDVRKDPDDSNIQSLPASSLGYNYASLWNLDHFSGYEPLIPKANQAASLNINFTASAFPDWFESVEKVDYYRSAGVRWYIVPIDKSEELSKILSTYGIIPMYEDSIRTVFYDEQAFPMAFVENKMEKSWNSVDTSTNSIRLQTNLDQPETIVFNYLFNPNFKAYIDGQKVPLTRYNALHMSVDVPEGSHDIVIRYSDPYFNIGIGLAGLFVFSLLAVALNKQVRDIYSRYFHGLSRKTKTI
ncbi:MAG: YfhO family protein [Clostridiales bacterium]|nr:YfhO family protein [Clostridiales bacterium]